MHEPIPARTDLPDPRSYSLSCVNSRTRLAMAGSTGRRSIELAP
jgi:hypothetical protein